MASSTAYSSQQHARSDLDREHCWYKASRSAQVLAATVASSLPQYVANSWQLQIVLTIAQHGQAS